MKKKLLQILLLIAAVLILPLPGTAAAEGELLDLVIVPTVSNIEYGTTQQFTAVATYSSGQVDMTASAQWRSSNPGVATIQTFGQTYPGLAHGESAGTTTIMATIATTDGSTRSVTATLTVNMPGIISRTIMPVNTSRSVGEAPVQYRYVVTYSNGTVDDVTALADWSSSDESVATISESGLAILTGAGTTSITGTFQGLVLNTSLTVSNAVLSSITVSPSSQVVAVGQSQQFIATGTYSDTSMVDLTDRVTWSSDDTSVAVIFGDGLARTCGLGGAGITATLGSISGSATLTITEPVLEKVVVLPEYPVIDQISEMVMSKQLTAIAVFSDGSSADISDTAVWTSSHPSATVDSSGYVMIYGVEVITITASYGGLSGTSVLTVRSDTTPPVISLNNPADGMVIQSTVLSVAGTVDDANAVVGIFVNGASAATPVVTGNAFSADVTLEIGMNSVEIRATDLAGNVGTSGILTVECNPNKPAISLTLPADGTVTKNTTMTVSGTFTGAMSVKLYVNGGAVATATTSPFSLLVTLREGTNSIVASGYSTGNEGNSAYIGSSGVKMVTRDTVGPVVTLTSPTSNCAVNTPGITIAGSVDDPSVESVTLNGVITIPVSNGKFSMPYSLVPGINTLVVSAADILGNVSAPVATVVLYDPTAPSVQIIFPGNNIAVNSGSQLIRGTIDDPSISSAVLEVNGVAQNVAVVNGVFSQAVALEEGSNTIRAVAANSLETGTSGEVHIILDTTLPKLLMRSVNSPDAVIVTVTADEPLTGGPVVMGDGGMGVITMMQTGINEWTGVVTGPFTAGQTYHIIANGTDLAGNASLLTFTEFRKDYITTATGVTATVNAGTVVLEITTQGNVTGQGLSLTRQTAFKAENDAKADDNAGIFLEITAENELTESIDTVYIQAAYDEDVIFSLELDERTLQFYTWDVATGRWVVEPDSGVNTAENYVWANVHHLSKFGVFGISITPEPPATTIPVVTTQAATDISFDRAVLNGGLMTSATSNVSFRWGLSPDALNNQTPIEIMSEIGTFSAEITGLSANTTYYYLAEAVTANATVHQGVIADFTTLAGIAGDADGNGLVNVLDMTRVARIILSLDTETAGADANHDGSVSVLDMTRIARIILGLPID